MKGKSTFIPWLPWIFFLAVTAVFFYKTVFIGLVPAPTDALVGLYYPWRDRFAAKYPRGVPFKNFLITDPVRQQISWRKLVTDDLKAGFLPRWNPYTFCGMTLIGNIQAAALYPVNILFLVLPFMTAWSVAVMMQPLLAMIWFYLFVRALKLPRLAATFGAFVWAFSGFFMSWLTWGTIDHVAAWFPLSLLAVIHLTADDRQTQRKSRVFWIIILGCSLALSFLAGHAQVALYGEVTVFAYLLFRWHRKQQSGRRFLEAAVWASAICMMLTAYVWIPFVKLMLSSPRISDALLAAKAGWFLPLPNLLQFLAPDYFGNPATMNYWGVWNYGEFIGYVGILSLIFVGIAAASKDREARFWTLVVVTALVLASANPLTVGVASLHIPVLTALQPTRLMVVADLALAVLTALGAALWITDKERNIKRPAAATVVVLALTVLGTFILRKLSSDPVSAAHLEISLRNLVIPSGILGVFIVLAVGAGRLFRQKSARTVIVCIAFALTAADLVRMGWKFTPFTSPEYFFPGTQLLTYLQTHLGTARVLAIDNRILPPNTGAYYGISTPVGYDSLYSSKYETFFASAARNSPDVTPPFGFNRILTAESAASPLWRIAGVKYVLDLKDISDPHLTPVTRIGSVRIYESDAYAPVAYLATAVSVGNNDSSLRKAMYADTFVPGKSAVITQPIDVASGPLGKGERVFLKQSPVGFSGSVSVLSPRLLEVTVTNDGNWRAFVDGKPVPIIRTNDVFVGIRIPSGQHIVQLKYSIW